MNPDDGERAGEGAAPDVRLWPVPQSGARPEPTLAVAAYLALIWRVEGLDGLVALAGEQWPRYPPAAR